MLKVTGFKGCVAQNTMRHRAVGTRLCNVHLEKCSTIYSKSFFLSWFHLFLNALSDCFSCMNACKKWSSLNRCEMFIWVNDFREFWLFKSGNEVALAAVGSPLRRRSGAGGGTACCGCTQLCPWGASPLLTLLMCLQQSGKESSWGWEICVKCSGIWAVTEQRVNEISPVISSWSRMKPLAWNQGLVMGGSLWSVLFWVFSFCFFAPQSSLWIQLSGKSCISVLLVTLGPDLPCLQVGCKQLREYFQGWDCPYAADT